MAIADPPRRPISPHERESETPHEAMSMPTSPIRIYSGDHQPIRLVAELQGISPAELVHRALSEYFRLEQKHLANLAQNAQRAFETGDYEALSAALRESAEVRSRRRADRLRRLSGGVSGG